MLPLNGADGAEVLCLRHQGIRDRKGSWWMLCMGCEVSYLESVGGGGSYLLPALIPGATLGAPAPPCTSFSPIHACRLQGTMHRLAPIIFPLKEHYLPLLPPIPAVLPPLQLPDTHHSTQRWLCNTNESTEWLLIGHAKNPSQWTISCTPLQA